MSSEDIGDYTDNNTININIEIDRLNVDDIAPEMDPSKRLTGGGIYLIIGPSGSGKSEIVKSLIWAKKSFIPICVAVSESEDINKTYSKIVPELFVYSKLDVEIINNIFARQRLASANLPNPWITVVFDDCMNKRSNFQEDRHIELFKISRHYKMFVLMTCQASFDLKPECRDQAAGYFILKSDNADNRKKIYSTYASIIPTRAEFNALMDQLTADYCCLFINNRVKSQNWKDKVFWFKAYDNIPSVWNATSKDVLEYNNDRFNTEYDPHSYMLKNINKKSFFKV
jgi:energy-coupling factor transporter ATP-binding protein EcfA2